MLMSFKYKNERKNDKNIKSHSNNSMEFEQKNVLVERIYCFKSIFVFKIIVV